MSVKRTHIEDETVSRAVEDLRLPLNDVLAGPLADARFLKENNSEELEFTSSVVKTIPHNLGRPYVGFLVVYSEGVFPVIDSGTEVNTRKEIALVSSSTGTGKVLIF